jgi:hypothetical protein
VELGEQGRIAPSPADGGVGHVASSRGARYERASAT